MGIVLVRRSADSNTSIDKSDAQMLAKWTDRETHDMVIACTGRETCAVDVWKYFGNVSGAKHNCPLWQPVKKPKSAVATTASSDGDPFEPPRGEIFACPQMVFLYGDCTKVNLPLASQIRPFGASSIREGRLLECVVDASEIPLWITPPRTDLAHRQALGEVSIKAIQWDKSPDLVLPLYIWYDHPSKSIVNNGSDATTTDKGKGKGDKDKGKHKDICKRTDKDDGKRTRLQQSQQQRLQSGPQPPPFPPPSHEPKPPRTRSPTSHPHRRARSASPRRRSPGRHSSRSTRTPRTPSPAPRRDVSCSDVPRLKPKPKWVAVANTYTVKRPRVELYPPRRSPSPAPRRSPSPERRTTVRIRDTIAQAYQHSTAPEDPVARAKYVKAYAPEFARNYLRWVAEAPDERGPHTDDAVWSEEDDTGIIEEVEEFETEKDHQPARVTMTSRSSKGARGKSSRRSRSPLRTRYTNPPASEQRRPPAQHARPYPWAQHSRTSQSVRAEAPVRAESPVRSFSPRHRGRSPTQSAARRQYVVMNAKQVKFK